MKKEERQRRQEIKRKIKTRELRPARRSGNAWEPRKIYPILNIENAKRLAARYAFSSRDWYNIKVSYRLGAYEYFEALETLKVTNRTLIEAVKNTSKFFQTLSISLSKRNRLSKDECDALRAEIEDILIKVFNKPQHKNDA